MLECCLSNLVVEFEIACECLWGYFLLRDFSGCSLSWFWVLRWVCFVFICKCHIIVLFVWFY